MIIFAINKFDFYVNIEFSYFFAITKNSILILTYFMEIGLNNVSWRLIVIFAHMFVTNTTTYHKYKIWLYFPVLFYFFYNMSKGKTGYIKLFYFIFALNCDYNCRNPLVPSHLFFFKKVFIYKPIKKRL